MTLIVGIKCNDGIVVGADGAATLGTIAQRTIQQPVKKLTAINNQAIIGVSGSVGLSQRFIAEVTRLVEARNFSKYPDQVMVKLRDVMWPHAEKEFQAAGVVSKAMGQVMSSPAMTHTVIALPILDEPSLFEFDHQCAPEEMTTGIPFVAVGSGKMLADPFLAFLRRMFWPRKLPNLSDGVFTTLWTLRYAIGVNTGGVSEPIQIMTLSRNGKAWQVRELTEQDVAEHHQNISDAEQALANYKDQQTTEAATEVPKPE